MSGRLVTLVLCDRQGQVLGQIAPFPVDTPWWQDMRPINVAWPLLTVLRLLHGVPELGATMGGEVTYLAEVDPASLPPLRPPPAAASAPAADAARAADVAADADEPLRMPWARPGGPGGDLAWAAGLVDVTGPAAQDRTWNLSSIWSMPSGEGRVWLKCVPGFFRHEASVLRLLAGQDVPTLIGTESHRMLLAELPGDDGHEASLEDSLPLITALVALQASTAARIDAFAAAGVPDARWEPLLASLRAVVDRRAPDDLHLRRLLDSAEARVAAIDACGLPDVLVHGDAHPGNARLHLARPVWFDWGDSRLGHPLLDLAVVHRAPLDQQLELERHWLSAWEAAVPGSNPTAAWELLRPLALLRGAVVYQGFLDNIEPSERVYHNSDVPFALHLVSQMVAGADKF